jgi:hypothetical protein
MSENVELNGLYLWKALMKDGCEWHGDVFSKKWAECVIVPANPHVVAAVTKTLEAYTEGVDYKVERNATGQISTVWTA